MRDNNYIDGTAVNFVTKHTNLYNFCEEMAVSIIQSLLGIPFDITVKLLINNERFRLKDTKY